MDNINLMKYWINSSDEDYDAMQVMYKIKRIHGLVFRTFSYRKVIKKDYMQKKNEENPYTIKSHNLLALAEKCNLDLTDEQVEKLQIITQFNISARYDDYKENFKQKMQQNILQSK